MIFKLHYFFQAAGCNALGILLGVYMMAYTDATPTEIGLLYMLMPFIGMTARPLICAVADRYQSHQKVLMLCFSITAISYFPFVAIPMLGPSLYEEHPRLTWYCLVAFKVVGDIAFGGSISIGDSLAINYAKRIGTDFMVYRVWATIAWMLFGVIVGQINEVWFLPKYVPGFMVLTSCCLLNTLVIYLWPSDYFVMVTVSEMEREQGRAKEAQRAQMKRGRAITRSLLPKEVVWAHAKRQLWALATFSCVRRASQANTGGSTKQEPEGVGASQAGKSASAVDKKTQARILLLLLRRDPRIVCYLLVFSAAGATVMPINFFFMSLAEICHTDNKCDFSKLAGLLQVAMSGSETVLFFYVGHVISKIGRVNTLSISFFLTAVKYLFYGTIWAHVDPHFALLSELPHGIIFGIYVTVSVQMGHLFSTGVRYLVPELIERGVVAADDESSRERLELSLAATMQALISSAMDGVGRGMGALAYGFIIDAYSFQTLWRVIGVSAVVVFVLLQAINLIDHCCGLELGLDVAAAKEQAEQRPRAHGLEEAHKDNVMALARVNSNGGQIAAMKTRAFDTSSIKSFSLV